MAEYRRNYIPGGTYFFTVVTYQRKKIFASEFARKILWNAWQKVQEKYPFDMVAVCLLPDHLHCIWTLPEDDYAYSIRWAAIKGLFSRQYAAAGGSQDVRNQSRLKRGESAIWQRRFWEHTIRNQEDFNHHVDYIHYNPVKHNLAYSPIKWHWSSFQRYVKEGLYEPGWGSIEPDSVKSMQTGLE